MVDLRSKRVRTSPSPSSTRPSKQSRKRQAPVKRNATNAATSNLNQLEQSPNLNGDDDSENNSTSKDRNTEEFISCFPSLTPENYEEQVSNWTLVELRKALVDQKNKKSRHKNQSPPDIQKLVQIIRMGYEKRMLMAALMGGISEYMIWSLVNEGPKKKKLNSWQRFVSFSHDAQAVRVPHRNDKEGWKIRNKELKDLWDKRSIDEKMVFEDPFFFALAKLPDLSKQTIPTVDDECNEEEDLVTQISAPQVHQLSEDKERNLRPLFDNLVDVEKLHLNHGRPEANDSAAKLQVKSLASFRKAHHDFATVCQRFHIHYHLSALSCDIQDGWQQVYSSSKSFSQWAEDSLQFTTKFRYYVHGKEVAAEIEKKAPQPVDARRGKLTRELNRLITEKLPDKKVFPKQEDPAKLIQDKGWPVRLVLKRPESLLLPEELSLGFRGCDDAQKRKWLSDIEKGFFYIELIPPEQVVPRPRKKSAKKASTTVSNSQSLGTTNQHNQDQTLSSGNPQSPTPTIQNTQTQKQSNALETSDNRKSSAVRGPQAKKKTKKARKPIDDEGEGDSNIDDEDEDDSNMSESDKASSGSESESS
ncbi:hypothetical protein DFH28DRAFT_1173069 [Melampsora americana]|nr:hypothetical protein DFH28DRAFT_1173069 [Melampsora americana]